MQGGRGKSNKDNYRDIINFKTDDDGDEGVGGVYRAFSASGWKRASAGSTSVSRPRIFSRCRFRLKST